jgi:predicted RecA/RadA family phage recombinase
VRAAAVIVLRGLEIVVETVVVADVLGAAVVGGVAVAAGVLVAVVVAAGATVEAVGEGTNFLPRNVATERRYGTTLRNDTDLHGSTKKLNQKGRRASCGPFCLPSNNMAAEAVSGAEH